MSYKFVKALGRNYSSRSRYGHGSTVKGITIHHWGSTGQKHANVVSWLRGYTGNRGSSAHYVVSDGLVTQIVDESNAAWHAGNNQGNGTTIGIECRPEMTAGDWATLVELCADIERRRGSMKYYRHKDWKNTACPGKYSSRIGELVKAVNAALKGKPPAKPKPKPAKPKPAKPKPAGKIPGPRTDFPWPDGHYIGPKDGPDRSHSGYFKNRKWSGQYDEHWLKALPEQLIRRGWSIGKGKTYLSRYGIDGRYGAEYEQLIRAFQREQGIPVDGLGGAQVWREAFHRPVS